MKYDLRNEYGQRFEVSSVIAYNERSRYATAILVSLVPKLVVDSNHDRSFRFVERKILGWIDFIAVSDMNDVESLQAYKDQNFCFAVAINDMGDSKSWDLQQCGQACQIAEILEIDVVPVVMHGITDTVAMNGSQIYPGIITVDVCEKVDVPSATTVEGASLFHGYFTQLYEKLVAEVECADYFEGLVLDRYKYKGVEVLNAVRRNLSKYKNYAQWIDTPVPRQPIFIADTGLGEFAMLFSLVHKDRDVTLLINDDDKATLAKYSLSDVAGNVKVVSSFDESLSLLDKAQAVYLIQPDELLVEYFSRFNPIIIQQV